MKLFTLILALFFTTCAWATDLLTPTRYLTINGLKVAVYESQGQKGPGILMVHGNTSSAQSYAKVMSSSFASRYRVVAVDLPGYGQSDNAASYNFGFFAGVIAQVAAAEGTDSGVLVGWSLGGDFTYQAIHLLPHLKGVFTFGTAPVGNAPQLPPPFLSPTESYAGQAVTYGTTANLTPEQITAYVTAFLKPNSTAPAIFVSEGERTDPQTRAAVLAAATGQDPTVLDEVAIVRNLRIPVALLIADQDAFVRRDYLLQLAPSVPTLWQNQIQVVKHSGHAIHWERPAKFVALLRRFVKGL